MPSHLMLVPSLACPAGCAYCFGPHVGAEGMGRETVDAVVFDTHHDEGFGVEFP